jgi:prepilin-type N-terminal cleavage/methylation domain-containing protein
MRNSPPQHHRAGFTIVEISVSSAIVLILLAGILTTYLQLTRSFRAVSNYGNIHADGRRAVDWFAKDMRGVYAINTYSLSNLTVAIPTNFNTSGSVTGTKTVRYTYSNGAYRRYDSATGQTVTLATNIYQLSYTLYDRLGSNTTLLGTAKSIQLDIKLRKFVNNQQQTEEYLSARYDMRNKPML